MPCLPVNAEVSGAEAGGGPSLPARVRSHRPDQIDLMLALTIHQMLGGDIAHIKQVLASGGVDAQPATPESAGSSQNRSGEQVSFARR
jgi:hypothetical protein